MVSIVIFELLHSKDTIVVCVIVAVAKCADRGDKAEEDSPFMRLPVDLEGTHGAGRDVEGMP